MASKVIRVKKTNQELHAEIQKSNEDWDTHCLPNTHGCDKCYINNNCVLERVIYGTKLVQSKVSREDRDTDAHDE